MLRRAVEPFPTPVRTLDALHLASLELLRVLGQRPARARYGQCLAQAATSLGIPLASV